MIKTKVNAAKRTIPNLWSSQPIQGPFCYWFGFRFEIFYLHQWNILLFLIEKIILWFKFLHIRLILILYITFRCWFQDQACYSWGQEVEACDMGYRWIFSIFFQAMCTCVNMIGEKKWCLMIYFGHLLVSPVVLYCSVF